jgi:hypothetical protein
MQSKASVQKVQLAHRRALALQLRKRGETYRAIAATLAGHEDISPAYNERGAWEDVTAELRRLQQQTIETAAQMQTLMLSQLDDLHASLWPRARAGDVYACDRILAIMDKKCRLLGIGSDPWLGLLAHIDITRLSVDQLRRLASGENPVRVLITT